MANLYYAASYKNKIINLLLKNQNFIRLVNPVPCPHDELDIVDVLLGGEWIINGEAYKEQGHIFDYNFVNDTITDKKTFTFIETDIDTVREDIFTDFNLYVCIFTEKELVRITDTSTPTVQEIKEMGYFVGNRANRIDVLCDIVDRTLNGSSELEGIGRIRPCPMDYMTIFCPSNNYYGKCLKYRISNYNEGGNDCGYQ